MNLRRHVLSASTSLEEPAMWRNVFPCDQPAVQGNDFELIPTVTIESRHSVDGPTGRDFVSIYRPIVRELWGPEVRSRSRFFQKSCLFEKNDPLRGNFQHFVLKWFSASRNHVLCGNFVKFGRPEVGEIARCLPRYRSYLWPYANANFIHTSTAPVKIKKKFRDTHDITTN